MLNSTIVRSICGSSGQVGPSCSDSGSILCTRSVPANEEEEADKNSNEIAITPSLDNLFISNVILFIKSFLFIQ